MKSNFNLSRKNKVTALALKLCFSLLALAVFIILLEISVRTYNGLKDIFFKHKETPLHILYDSPVLYGLNPDHPEVSSQGLRDDEVPLSKPRDTIRILILGDSIPYGPGISRGKIFPDVLERQLRERFGSVDVINAGVIGYTPYNELYYYLTEGRKFQPDIVILSFCMNDVVNPRLHWHPKRAGGTIARIPEEAIPNHDYDVNHILPKLSNMNHDQASIINRSVALQGIMRRIKLLSSNNTKPQIQKIITGEDDISIEVLLDKQSPEWQWLRSKYNQIRDAVKKDGAELIIVWFPLAYQLDSGYPFFPQGSFSDYCRENNINCIDILNTFRKKTKQDLFLLDKVGSYDVWHLSETGHRVAAQGIYDYLATSAHLQGRDKKAERH